MQCKFLLIALCLVLPLVFAGHEILLPYSSASKCSILPSNILIIQFESRPISSFWNTSIVWNADYAFRFRHRYQLYTSTRSCRLGNEPLGESWCKVKAMLEVSKEISADTFVVFLDSDAIITTSYSFSSVICMIQDQLGWNIMSKPIAFNQDGPGFACVMALRLGYNMCLNSGTVLFTKSPSVTSILESWWFAANSRMTTKFKMNWRVKVRGTAA